AQLAQQATLADTTLIYYSGQETLDTIGHYRLSASRAAGRTDWLSDHEFKRLLAAIPGRLMLAIDTVRLEQNANREMNVGFCGSASQADNLTKLDTAANDFLRDLLSDEYGIVVLRASRRQVAGESTTASTWFAQALSEAVTGKADENGDGTVE